MKEASSKKDIKNEKIHRKKASPNLEVLILK